MAKKAKKAIAASACDCVEKVDAKLAEFNTRLSRSLALNFATGQASTHISIATEKVDTKKRGSAKKVWITYCPFCGKMVV